MAFVINLSNKRALAGLIVLICGLALVFYLPTILSETNPQQCIENGVCLHEERINLLTTLLPIFVLIGILFGAVVFFFMTSKLESKKMDAEKITQTLVQFLSKDEKAIVQKILDNDGKAFQSEISRIEGIGKLKSHRILQRLSDRGVIQIEKHGKTNIITLPKNIRDTLLK